MPRDYDQALIDTVIEKLFRAEKLRGEANELLRNARTLCEKGAYNGTFVSSDRHFVLIVSDGVPTLHRVTL